LEKTSLIIAELSTLLISRNPTGIYPSKHDNSLRRELLDRIDEEKKAIVGPYLKSRKEMISMVLKDENLG